MRSRPILRTGDEPFLASLGQEVLQALDLSAFPRKEASRRGEVPAAREVSKAEREGAGRREPFAGRRSGKVSVRKVVCRARRQLAGAKSSLPDAAPTCRSRRQASLWDSLPAGRKSNQLFEFSRSRRFRQRAAAPGNGPERMATSFLERQRAEANGNEFFEPATRRSARLRTFCAANLPAPPAAKFSLRPAPGRSNFLNSARNCSILPGP